MKPVSLSLRWQIIILATFVLAMMAWAFAWQQHATLTRQFMQESAKTKSQQTALVAQLFLDQAGHLQNLAGMFANVPVLRQGLQDRDREALTMAFMPFWAELNVGTSLETARFYADDGSLLSAWGEAGDAAILSPPRGRPPPSCWRR